MTFDEFVKTYQGKATDYDGAYGVQCVDLAKLYIDKVLGIKPQAIGNAEAYWNRYNELDYLKTNFERIANTPSFVPQKGDIAVWGLSHGKWGHIAICTGEGTTSEFYSYDQNWGGKGQGMTKIKHTYKSGFEGVLRPRNQTVLCIEKTQPKVTEKAIEVRVPIVIAHDNGGSKVLVESQTMQNEKGEKQFWIHRSVIQDGQIIARAIIEQCKVKVFDDGFCISSKDIVKFL